MGFIADQLGSKHVGTGGFSQRAVGPSLWREVFGRSTHKEAGASAFTGDRKPSVPGGAFGRTSISGGAAFKRLLEAFRSSAPGGWSDDRWEESKHLTGIAYVAITAICRQLSQAEFQLFRRDRRHPEGKVPVKEDDPPEGGRQVRPFELVELLEKPNRQDSFGKMMYRWGQQLRLTGSALTWMVPNQLGVPMELYPIPTAMAIPQAVINADYPEGFYRIQPIYPYGPFSSYPTPASAVGAAIPAQWMLRFLYPHPFLRYDGYSPLTGLRLHMDEVEMMDRSRFYSMKRSVNPSAVLNFDEMEGAQPLPEEEIDRIHAEWENTFQGPENHGNLIVGAPGGRFEPWGVNPREMDYQSGWDQLTSFIMGGFGITRPAAGMIEDASYSTLFATLKQLHTLTLEPDCADIASDLTRHLAPFFGDDLILEIKCRRIDDHDLNFSKITIAMNAMAITKNGVLRALDLPTTHEPWGNEIAGQPPQPPPGAGGGGGDLAALLGGAAGGGAGGPPGQEGANGAPPQEDQEPGKEKGGKAPSPEEMGEGALGPRKSLPRKPRQPVYSGKNRVGGLLAGRKRLKALVTAQQGDRDHSAPLNGYAKGTRNGHAGNAVATQPVSAPPTPEIKIKSLYDQVMEALQDGQA